MVKRNAKARARRIDVTDVERSLVRKNESAKAQEKLKSGDLFYFDTNGNEKSLPKALRRGVQLEKKQKGLSKLSHYEIAKVEKVKAKEERKAVKAGIKNAKKTTAASSTTSKDAATSNANAFDLWGGAAAKEKAAKQLQATSSSILEQTANLNNGSLFKKSEDRKTHHMLTRHKCRVLNDSALRLPHSKPTTLQNNSNKTCAAPAVVLPETGLSMNPGEEAFERQVDEVVADECAKMRSEEQEARKKKPMTSRLLDAYSQEEVSKMTEAERQKEYRRLIAEDLIAENMDLDVEEMESDEDATSPSAKNKSENTKESTTSSTSSSGIINKKVIKAQERKTKAQKNKEGRLKERMKNLSAEKRQKLLDKSIGQLPNLMREMETDNMTKKQEKEYLAQLKEEEKKMEEKGIVLKPKKIGRNRFQETKLLPQKAASSLRGSQVESAISERMQSIHRRNLTELPPDADRSTLLRLRKKKNRDQRAVQHHQRQLKINEEVMSD
ncbi:unnamed protein product [Amoebophrya sp. A25]|nr:unnamed protein product [Amoebophrya sp. A25]|eukprot:GSA25T00004728001.1